MSKRYSKEARACSRSLHSYEELAISIDKYYATKAFLQSPADETRFVVKQLGWSSSSFGISNDL